MAFCAKCGAQLTDGAAFCASCGSPVGGAVTPERPVAAGTGLAPNVGGLLAYVPFAGWIIAVVFLLSEPYKNDKFIRFHAIQSIIFNVAVVIFWIAYSILARILGLISFGLLSVGLGIVGLLIFLVILAYWVFLMYKAYSYERYMIPYIGPLAEKQAGA